MNLRKKGKQGKSYGIIGLGRFGKALALQLAESGKELLVIDADEDCVRELRDYTENAYIVKNLDKKSLLETGIQNCDVAIICIGEKIDISILTTLTLTSMGIPQVIAKASSIEHGEILEKLGAEVVYPERDMAIRLARRFESSKILNYIELSENIDISKIPVPPEFIGKTILDLDIRKKFGLNIIAIEQNGEISTDISPEHVFQKGDAFFVIGDFEKLHNFESSLK